MSLSPNRLSAEEGQGKTRPVCGVGTTLPPKSTIARVHPVPSDRIPSIPRHRFEAILTVRRLRVPKFAASPRHFAESRQQGIQEAEARMSTGIPAPKAVLHDVTCMRIFAAPSLSTGRLDWSRAEARWRLLWVKRDGAGARTRSEPWWLRHLPTARRSTALRAGITSVEACCLAGANNIAGRWVLLRPHRRL